MKRLAIPSVAVLMIATLCVGDLPVYAAMDMSRIIGTQTMLIRQKATQEQIKVAQQRAKAYVAKLGPVAPAAPAPTPPPSKTAKTKPPKTTPPKATVDAPKKQKKPRYIAVDTVRSKTTSPKAKKTVMIWDTETAALASTDVYDLEAPPAVGTTAKFDTYSAQYVGSGG